MDSGQNVARLEKTTNYNYFIMATLAIGALGGAMVSLISFYWSVPQNSIPQILENDLRILLLHFSKQLVLISSIVQWNCNHNTGAAFLSGVLWLPQFRRGKSPYQSWFVGGCHWTLFHWSRLWSGSAKLCCGSLGPEGRSTSCRHYFSHIGCIVRWQCPHCNVPRIQVCCGQSLLSIMALSSFGTLFAQDNISVNLE